MHEGHELEMAENEKIAVVPVEPERTLKRPVVLNDPRHCVLSSSSYNRAVGLASVAPITNEKQLSLRGRTPCEFSYNGAVLSITCGASTGGFAGLNSAIPPRQMSSLQFKRELSC